MKAKHCDECKHATIKQYLYKGQPEFEVARIAALHKSAPEVIWLQVDPEAEQFDGWEAQTWCSDKINETDVKYIRADLMPNNARR